jgi:hypothetical protein
LRYIVVGGGDFADDFVFAFFDECSLTAPARTTIGALVIPAFCFGVTI